MEAKKVLIVHGGWEGHEPTESTATWAGILRDEGCAVDTADSLDALTDYEKVATYDLLVPNWTMGSITKEQAGGFQAATKTGTGIAGFHGGMGDAFRGSIGYQFITGIQFMAHPDGVKDWSVEITRPDDPIVAGIGDFDITSEQYYMLVDPNHEVLARTTFHPESAPWAEGRTMPVVMKKIHQQSRVFYSAIGHKAKEFEIPQVREIQRRGFLWAMR